MLRLADLLSDIANSMGYYYNSSSDTDMDSDANKPRQKQIKRLINDAYLSVMRLMPKDFLRRERVIKIPAVYEAGTIEIRTADATVTGTDTVFTRNMQMRQILPSGAYRPAFLRLYTSGIVFDLAATYMDTVVAAGTSYKIATWALPLPYDFLAPFGKRSVVDLDNNNPIPLIPRGAFRNAYRQVYGTGKPSQCCIDGVTTFARRGDGDTVSVTKDETTIQFAGCQADGSEVGSIIKLEGDSIPYKILTAAALDATVSPVVQRATDASINYEIDPPPLPLLWFNRAPSVEFHMLLNYFAKPEYLWTDEQTAELAGGYELAFRKMALYNVLSSYSRDKVQKIEALSELTMALKVLPKYIDTTPIMKEINADASDRRSGVTFPNVDLAT